jgi:N utilization substance protein A
MNLLQAMDQVERERGIRKEILIETLEAALKTAAKKVFGEQRDIEAQYNEETHVIELFMIVTVAEDVVNEFREISVDDARRHIDPNAEVGDELLFQIFYLEEERERARDQDRRYGHLLRLESARRTFGRIAAQTAKQVILQRVREAERQIIFDEFKDRKGELITGSVRRFEKGSIIVDLGRTDGILEPADQTRRESYRPGDRIQAYVKDVRATREYQIVLSRTDPGLVIKLFEKEVPEIYDGIVQIVNVARESGVRSKVAVYSTDSDVDPVGACVGMRGSRVQSVVQELRGEKIDIVPFNEDPARYVCNAISPAQVAKVLVDEAKKTMELVVPDDQLSLAIGRNGQNVRLASELTQWNLEVYSETKLRQLMGEAKRQLLEFEGVAEPMIDALFQLGYNKLSDIASAEVLDIARLPGFGEDAARTLIEAAGALTEVGRRSTSDAAMTEEDLERRELEAIRGVGEKVAAALYAGGYVKPLLVALENDRDRMAFLTALDPIKCKQILRAAEEWYEQQNFSEDEKVEHEDEQEEMFERLDALVEEREAAAAEADEEAEGADEEAVAETLVFEAESIEPSGDVDGVEDDQ